MEKKTKKTLLGIFGIGLAAVALSSCTANFCSDTDKAEMLYPYEQGVTVYCSETEYNAYLASDAYTDLSGSWQQRIADISGLAYKSGNTAVYKYVPVTVTINTDNTETYSFAAAKASQVNTVISSLRSNNYGVPTVEYWAAIDQYVLEASTYNAYARDNNQNDYAARFGTEDHDAIYASVSDAFLSSITLNDVSSASWCVNPYVESDTAGGSGTTAIELKLGENGNSLLRYYGAVKFENITAGDSYTSSTYSRWVKILRASDSPYLGEYGTISKDGYSVYQSTVASLVSAQTSCIATTDDAFGHYGSSKDWEVAVEAKDWGYAWSKGFLEGLLVYPISYMVDTFAYAIDPALTGTGQIWSIIIVALIVRGLMALLTLPSTISQQKMTALQPQLQRIQAKYPNANNNQSEKLRMSQETQALYKRNGVHMFLPFLVLIIQFPVFICVWSAMRGSAALASGSFLNLSLSDTISETLMNFSGTWYANTTGWWTALILFLVMTGAQLAAILVPRILQKRRQKKLGNRLTSNPAQDQQAKTMKWMTYGMFAITIITGFFLPSAMGVYWFIGAIISLAQNLIVQAIAQRQIKKKGIK